MLYRASLTALLALALSVGLTACSSNPPEEPESPESQPSVSVVAPVKPEPEPVLPYVNPLTGEGCAQDIAQKRPVAVMLNNLKKALPQLGVSQADIIYEAPAEGGITRMLAVFQSVEEVGNIGSVRSARDYYVSLAMGHDALYLHAGGSPGAYAAIKNWGAAAFDCVNGPYEGTLFWRDKERRKHMGMEHSVLTSGSTISELMPTYSYRLEHKEGYQYPAAFLADVLGEETRGEGLGIAADPAAPGQWFGEPTLTASGYVASLPVCGQTVSGTALRRALGLRSACFNIRYQDGSFLITTKGYGHGVGLSQWGAKALAEQGQNFADILAHYYPGTSLSG